MRKSRSEAAQTRSKIVRAAAREFNEKGIQGAEIMAAAGLTHGGFYKHFKSKNQLVAEAVAKGMDRIKTSAKMPRPTQSLEEAAGEYLSKRHRDDLASACPLGTLGSELCYADNHTPEAWSLLRASSFIGSLQRLRSWR